MRQKLLLFHLCLVASLTSIAVAAEPAYNYDVVADINSHVSGIALLGFGSVAINDLDTVIFTARYNDGSYAGAFGVFTPKGVILKKGDTVRGLTVEMPALCGVNDFDEVALTFSYGDRQQAIGKFVRKGSTIVPVGKLVKTGDTIDGLSILFFRECAINDVGEIAFSADYLDSSGNEGTGAFTLNKVLVKNGSQVQGIPISQNNFLAHLDGFSDLGTIAFDTVQFLSSSESATAAFTQHRVLALPGQTVDGFRLVDASSPVISHFDRVAFSGAYAVQPSCYFYYCMGSAVFDRDGVVAKTGDTISGITFTNSIAAVGINDEGTVLMQANFATGYGLFTNKSVVAATGDVIGGFYADGFFSETINDSGNVAFVIDQAVILAKHRGKFEKRN